jgi:hypothetical protein
MQAVLDASDSSEWILANSGEETDGVRVVAGERSRNVVLPLADHVISSELARVSQIVAAYAQDDEHGTKHVFCVVAEHAPAAYAGVLDAEERITKRLPHLALHTHVRAHQGRSPSAAVPLTSSPIYVR